MDYIYTADVVWKCDHLNEVHMGNGPVMDFSAPPESHGIKGVLTPEDAFVSAVNTCVMMMFIWACERFKIDLKRFSCHAKGTKKIFIDKTELFTQVVLQPRIVAKGSNSDRRRIERALKSAEKYSLVANSIKSKLIIEPEIIME